MRRQMWFDDFTVRPSFRAPQVCSQALLPLDEGRILLKPAPVRAPDPTAQGGAPSDVRTGLDADAIGQALIDNLHCLQAKLPQHATRNDWYMALAYTVRDRMLDRYVRTVEAIAGRACDRQSGRVSSRPSS